jgi:hypothetical protein
MSYKAFVSSTFKNRRDDRAHVIRALRNAGFDVDPMEDRTSSADARAPQPKRCHGCHFNVTLALV